MCVRSDATTRARARAARRATDDATRTRDARELG